ncbi:MAG: electron transfer flavoprotein subunit beta/FixA family protein [Syntrophales bacterium]
MPLSIIVCIKQVPDPESFDKITLDPVYKTVRRSGIPVITNPADRHALEEALRIKDETGAFVTVITMGPPQARKSLEEALATGADRGVILCDQAFAGADTLSTACTLAGGIRFLGGYDLILCGNETVDGATGQVPAQLAEFLDLPHVTYVRKIDVIGKERKAVVERILENGYLRVEVKLPAVIAVLKGINRYRLPTVMGIMEAATKEILDLGCPACESAGVDPGMMGLRGSPTRVADVFESRESRSVEMISGEPREIAKRLVRRLHQMEAI